MEKITDFKNFKILYLEENNLDKELLFDRLSQICDNVLFASNYNEAEKLFEKESINLIISEIKPSIGGLDFIKEVRSVDYWTPIIIIRGPLKTSFRTSSFLFS